VTKRIVLIEDDADLFALLKYNLEKEGFQLTGSQTGLGAVYLCRRARPDLILLDIMLPDSDGLDICKGIRKDPELAQTPIIFLTARASETDRIVGLELGANDYIVKPFFIREVIARIKLQFRTQTAPSRLLKAGGLELDRSSCQVKLDGELLALTATEFRLLEFLMTRPGVVFSREQLLNSVWGQDRAITDRTVDVYILRLRQKIEKDASSPGMIHSVRGFGYSFEPRNRHEMTPADQALETAGQPFSPPHHAR
jgi:DNA-binding response OmpR family regulator